MKAVLRYAHCDYGSTRNQRRAVRHVVTMSQSSIRRLFLPSLLLLGVLAVAAGTGWSSSVPAVVTQKVARRTMSASIIASGELWPRESVEVSSNVSGRIAETTVRPGDVVKHGQVLVRIEQTQFVSALGQAEASLKAQLAELERALSEEEISRLSYERGEKLQEQGLLSQEAFERARLEYRSSRAAVEGARQRSEERRAAVRTVAADLERTTIRSPMDGTVISVNRTAGENVIGAQSFAPTVILTVGELTSMRARLLVDETNSLEVATGQAATLRVEAAPQLELRGHVAEVAARATARPASLGGGSAVTREVAVVVELESTAQGLRPGMSVTAKIVTATKNDTLAVPIEALVARAAPGASAAAADEPKGSASTIDGVFLFANGRVLFEPVETGLTSTAWAEIRAGLSEGQEVVTGPNRLLQSLVSGASARRSN
jgi:HlyD family secretion protein